MYNINGWKITIIDTDDMRGIVLIETRGTNILYLSIL